MKFVIGVDTGGTFTDCVAIGEDGSVAWDKAHTTPQDHTVGILNAIENTSARLGLSRSDLLGATVALGIGSTVGLNALLARGGAKTCVSTDTAANGAVVSAAMDRMVSAVARKPVVRIRAGELLNV